MEKPTFELLQCVFPGQTARLTARLFACLCGVSPVAGCEQPSPAGERARGAVAPVGQVSQSQQGERAQARSQRPPDPVPGLQGVTGPELLAAVKEQRRGALVNMWASWCGSCKKELPILAELAEVYGDEGLGLLLVSADTSDAYPAARALLDGLGIDRSAYYIAGSVAAFKRAVHPRWKGAIPATFLIDGAGKVRFFWNGPVAAEEVTPVVQRYLSGEEVDGELDVAARPVAQ